MTNKCPVNLLLITYESKLRVLLEKLLDFKVNLKSHNLYTTNPCLFSVTIEID